jgi:hypothetical protein
VSCESARHCQYFVVAEFSETGHDRKTALEPIVGVAGGDCQRVLDRPVDGIWASDHFGVLADLVLPANRPGFRS